MKIFFERFGTVLGAVTVGLLLMSVVHEYGYFWPIGRHFQTFLTTTDYFANAVLWLPALFISTYAYFDWDIISERKRYHPIGFNWKGILVFTIMVLFPLMAFFLLPPSPTAYAVALIFFWLTYGKRILPEADSESEAARLVRRALIIAPVLLMVLFAWGLDNGRSALTGTSDVYAIHTKQGQVLHRVLLRTLDKGVLVRNAVDDQIEFMRWDDILKVSKLAPRPSNEPLSCSWFGIGISCRVTPSI